jgi:DNA-3-methyladenine glycosylase II
MPRGEVTPDYWHEATAFLARRDKVLRKLIKAFPEPQWAIRGDAFQTLARSIVGQQISVKAAESIWGRFAALAGKVEPVRVAALADEALRACGFSGQKCAYVKDLARRFAAGEIKPRGWARKGDEAIIEELVQVKGIGRWTVEMFLMFHLKRPDVLPLDDLGLRRAMERLYHEGEPLTKAQMREIGDRWAPWRSVGSWYLWRSLEKVPAKP